MKNIWMAATSCACLALSLSPAGAREALQGPTELLYWDKTKAYNGYTLFSARGSYLIDMEGRVVHTWPIGTTPRLLENGNLLDATKDDPSGFPGFKELDWDGNVVWEYAEAREGYAPHHDWVRIFNKKLGAPTMLYIANKSITHEQAVAAGADPRRGPFEGAEMDAIVEIDMEGNVIWQWRFFDHVVQDVDPTKPNYVGEGKTIADYPGRININLPGRPLKRDWLHCNSLDYHAELDQIVTNSVQGEFYEIDHSTFVPGDPELSIALAAGPAGEFLYRFGDPARYAQGNPPSIREDWTQSTTGHKQIGGSHDVHWIKPGLPGAGNFLIFNNGQYLFERTPQSYVVEINGFLDADGRNTGNYVNPPDAGYHRWEPENRDTHKATKQASNQIVWMYYSKSNQGFFSHIGSGAQRLPNGNTLICAMTEGHFFEVTPDGDLAWEYINPVTRDGALKVLPDNYPMANAVFRAYRYGPDHPALQGKDLSPKGTITERYAQGLDRNLVPRREPRGDRGTGQGGRGGPGGRDQGQDRRGGDGPGDQAQGGRQPTIELRETTGRVTAPGATLVELADGFQFTEGPAPDADGNVFFTDLRVSLIYRWSTDGQLSVYRENTCGANGLFFDRDGNLLACEGDDGRITAIDPQGNVTVLADRYNNTRFNKTNDLWIDRKGGVYFSDPAYGGAEVVQDGEHVYYITPDRRRVVRVIDDMVRPNGLIGTPDGKTLYVTDAGARETYRYAINDDGTLSDKTRFVSVGSDGMTIDTEGNVYLTENGVLAFDPAGRLIEQIPVPNRPTNVCFAGIDRQTLFITARSSVYSIRMRVQGVPPLPKAGPRGSMQRPDDGRQPPPGGAGQRGPGGGQGRPRHPVTLALDPNGDGEISAEEIAGGARALKALDTDGDGTISREEMRPADDDRRPRN